MVLIEMSRRTMEADIAALVARRPFAEFFTEDVPGADGFEGSGVEGEQAAEAWSFGVHEQVMDARAESMDFAVAQDHADAALVFAQASASKAWVHSSLRSELIELAKRR